MGAPSLSQFAVAFNLVPSIVVHAVTFFAHSKRGLVFMGPQLCIGEP